MTFYWCLPPEKLKETWETMGQVFWAARHTFKIAYMFHGSRSFAKDFFSNPLSPCTSGNYIQLIIEGGGTKKTKKKNPQLSKLNYQVENKHDRLRKPSIQFTTSKVKSTLIQVHIQPFWKQQCYFTESWGRHRFKATISLSLT